MTMLMPTRRNYFNDLMADPFDAFFNTPFTPAPKSSSTLMRTDIKEHDDGFEMTIDLPGFKKEDVQAELKDGYLTVNAETKTETSEGDEKGHLGTQGALRGQVQPYILRGRGCQGRGHQGPLRERHARNRRSQAAAAAEA